MARWVCGILAFCLIFTMGVNVVRKINGVDNPMYMQEIVQYLGKQQRIENTVVTEIATVNEVLQVGADIIEIFQELQIQKDNIDEELNFFEFIAASIADVIIGALRDIIIGIEGIVVALTIIIYFVPLSFSILREFVYLARIAAYVLFDVPLVGEAIA